MADLTTAALALL